MLKIPQLNLSSFFFISAILLAYLPSNIFKNFGVKDVLFLLSFTALLLQNHNIKRFQNIIIHERIYLFVWLFLFGWQLGLFKSDDVTKEFFLMLQFCFIFFLIFPLFLINGDLMSFIWKYTLCFYAIVAILMTLGFWFNIHYFVYLWGPGRYIFPYLDGTVGNELVNISFFALITIIFRKRYLIVFLLPFIFFAISIEGTRTSLLEAIIMLLAIFIIWFKQTLSIQTIKGNLLSMILILVVSYITVILTMEHISSIETNVFVRMNIVDEVRRSAFSEGLMNIPNNLLFGNGLYKRVGEDELVIHNYILQSINAAGLIGFIGFMGINLFPLYKGLKLLKKGNKYILLEDRLYAYTAVFVIANLFIEGLFNPIDITREKWIFYLLSYATIDTIQNKIERCCQ